VATALRLHHFSRYTYFRHFNTLGLKSQIIIIIILTHLNIMQFLSGCQLSWIDHYFHLTSQKLNHVRDVKSPGICIRLTRKWTK